MNDLIIANNTQQIIASGSGIVVGNTNPTSPNPNAIFSALEQELLEDYRSSRENTNELIEIGKTALQEVLAIASQGQHPRFYEAAALLIKTMNETNINFMDAQQKLYEIKEIKDRLGTEGRAINIDKAVFVGTTQELLKQVKAKKTIEMETN